MSATAPEDSRYQPDAPIKLPPLYAWPPRPRAALRWLFSSLLFPWGFFFIGLSFVAWYLLTPPLAEMAELRPGWVALLWLRNAALLTLVAGGLHWLLYIRRRQGRRCKFDRRWPNTGSEMFLWRDQVRDNMFWSIASGVTIWTLYEAVTLRLYAGGALPVPPLHEFPLYCAVMMIGVFFWSTAHFYFNHRPAAPGSRSTAPRTNCTTAMSTSGRGPAFPCTRWSMSFISVCSHCGGWCRCIRWWSR